LIIADYADVSKSGYFGVYASDETTINADYIDASNAHFYGIYARNRSVINAPCAKAQRIPYENTTLDFYVENNGIINVYSGIGGTNIKPNILTPNGVIFK